MSSSVNRIGKLLCCVLMGFISAAVGWAVVTVLYDFCSFMAGDSSGKVHVLLIVLVGIINTILFTTFISDDMFTEG